MLQQVGEVRALSHHRWNSAMDQMSAQLDAINAMACKMDQDFKVKLLSAAVVAGGGIFHQYYKHVWSITILSLFL